ncbi:hypothetical protein D3C79_808190 [compost metagenome]
MSWLIAGQVKASHRRSHRLLSSWSFCGLFSRKCRAKVCNDLFDRLTLDFWWIRTFTKLSPHEHCQLCAIRQRFIAVYRAEGLQCSVSLILPEQRLYPRVDRNEMKVDGVAGVVAKAAYVQPFGLQ